MTGLGGSREAVPDGVSQVQQQQDLEKKLVLFLMASENEREAQDSLESPTSDVNQRPKRRKIETEKVRAARDEESPDVWAQCENPACNKWRRLPPHTALNENEPWFCRMNADPNFNSCDIPEATYDQEGSEADVVELAAVAEQTDAVETDAVETDAVETDAADVVETDLAPVTRAEVAPRVATHAAADEREPDDEEPQLDEADEDDEDDAPYQPPAPGTAAANGDDEELEDIFDHYRSDRPSRHALQGTFLKDVYAMMIGFGDDEAPSMETVEFVEDALVSYSVEILKAALDLSKQRGRIRSTGKPTGPPTAEDIVTVVRKDPRKVKRIEELMIMQQEIKVAQDTIEKQVRAVMMATVRRLLSRVSVSSLTAFSFVRPPGGSRDLGARAREHLTSSPPLSSAPLVSVYQHGRGAYCPRLRREFKPCRAVILKFNLRCSAG